jgi:hypothetical protein
MADITPQQLKDAADNLARLRAWVTDLYPLCIEYEVAVFDALGSTTQNGDWTNFVVNTVIDIAIAMAAAAALAGEAPAVIPALAALSSFLHDWGIGKDRPGGLSATFAKFQFGHEKMQFEIEQKLSSLVDPTNNYKSLSDEWKDSISFNGRTYTIGDLATSRFPGLGNEYNALQSAARTQFHKMLWNLAIMKTCRYYENYHIFITLEKKDGTSAAVSKWAQESFYKNNPGVFIRYAYIGTNDPPGTNQFEIVYWNLGLGGYALAPEACKQLFMDDTPGHIINPGGLFNRRYVFEQFSTRKPDFGNWRDLSDGSKGPPFNFTGGLFPEETAKTTQLLVIPKATEQSASA